MTGRGRAAAAVILVVVLILLTRHVQTGPPADMSSPATKAAASRAAASGVGAAPPSASSTANTPAPSPSATLPVADGSLRPPGAEIDHATSPAPTAQLVSVARTFVAAWTNVDGGRAAWLARLAPLSTRRLLQGLRMTDLARVPAVRVLPGGNVRYASGSDALVDVPTTAGTLTLVLAASTRGSATSAPHPGWLTSSIAPRS